MAHDVLFDASRLLSRAERAAPTGVDRVCLAYAEWLLGQPNVRLLPVRSKHDHLVMVDEDWFQRCVGKLRQRWNGHHESMATSASEADLIMALKSVSTSRGSILGPTTTPKEQKTKRHIRVWKQLLRSHRMPDALQGQIYFNVGHTSLNTPGILKGLAERHIQRVVFLHDLIPITHPEFCRPGDGEKHRVRVLTTLRHASRILVNSQYTAEELAAFAKREGLTAPPIDAVHLGLESTFLQRSGASFPRPYFVHVGTIEARKNLAFLLTIWRRLQERMGEAAPQLVLVGRYGWENEAVLDHLERSPNLRGLVHQTADLPDAALARLMLNAQAVVAPSSVEGFDLPSVEACALGVPLIASDIPAHRELVPQAELIDPLDGLGWLTALERATIKRPQVGRYEPPTWPDHFAEVARQVGLN